jgi:hypothetical protein
VRTKNLRSSYPSRYPGPDSNKGPVRILCVVLALALALPLAAPFASAGSRPSQGGWDNGLIGFITDDGLFFVEVGDANFIGGFQAFYNGSQVYTYQLILNLTSLSRYTETATIRLVDTDSHQGIANLTVPMSGYSNQFVYVTLPTEHSWTDMRITVDGTSGYFQWATPYTILSIGNLFNGGIDLAVFIGFGIYLWLSYPLGIKSERMTKRAVYAPEWKAAWWLHGIVVGFLATYAIYFTQINMFFKGAEVFLIPIPEAFFFFFWNAGRHSRRTVLKFKQPVTISGRPFSYIERKFFGGIDQNGNIVLVRFNSRSVLQWWYRSRGHHVVAWAMFEDGTPATRFTESIKTRILEAQAKPASKGAKPSPAEPLMMPIYDYESLTPDQLRDPTRLPKSGLYDQFRGTPVLGEGGNQEENVSYEFRVARISDFRFQEPHMSIWKTVTESAYVDPEGVVHEGETKQKLTWPHIVDGSAQITLLSWHAQSIDAQNHGYMDTEDLVQVIADKDAALWAARGEIERLTEEKAERKTLANRDIRNRRSSDYEQEDFEEMVDRASTEKKGAKVQATGT